MNPFKKLFFRLMRESAEREPGRDVKLQYTVPALSDGWWHLDIWKNMKHHVVMWNTSLNGFGVSDPTDPERVVLDEDAVVAWLWP